MRWCSTTHARSGARSQSLDASTQDLTWAINVRAALLLVEAFAAQYRPHPQGGRIALSPLASTEAQHRRRFPSRHQGRAAPDHHDAGRRAGRARHHGQPRRSRNHDTGWASPEQDSFVARHMPRGRWNTPAEAADVVALLLSSQAATTTGQVIDAEGGFRRFTPSRL